MRAEELHNFDFGKPYPFTNDMRTAYHHGHRQITDPPKTGTYATLAESFDVYRQPVRSEDIFKTENNDSFNWKIPDQSLERNPRIELNKVHGMKPFDGRNYREAPKPINTFETINNIEYSSKSNPSAAEILIYQNMQYCNIKPSKVVIDPEKPGSAKHLDLMATTNTLDYIAHTNRELAQNDILTVWNWLGEYNKKMCEHMKTSRPLNMGTEVEILCPKGPSNMCPKRKGEFATTVKNVPHSGLTSETRDNYKIPIIKSEIQAYYIKPIKTIPQRSLVPQMGMNHIYGTGESLHKFLSIRDYGKINK